MNFDFPTEETIAALASAVAPGQGGIAVIRISGPCAKKAAQAIVNIPGNKAWKSHTILYGHVVDQKTTANIDEVLILVMDGPKSFTGEDVVEIQCHGGLITVQRVLEEILKQPNVRRAMPGEFSQRAVLNGRLNLTQAEAINDLISAKTKKAAQLAIAGVEGHLNLKINNLRNKLLDNLSEIEARIDFADELPPLNRTKLIKDLKQVQQKLDQLVLEGRQGRLIRNGLKVALIGLPNVGKSSLLNLLSQEEKAIVTNVPGTTRDLLESEIILEGIPITLIDSAGIRPTKNVVEKIGIARSEKAIMSADIVIIIFDLSIGWNKSNQDLLSNIPENIPKLVVGNKVDLKIESNSFKPDVHMSALTGEGKEDLIFKLLKIVGATKTQGIEIALNERQIDLVSSCSKALSRVLAEETQCLPWDFWTIDLREAVRNLGELTGDEISEAILDRIFSRFCIGK